MRFWPIFIFLIQFTAAAETPCLRLLTSPAPLLQEPTGAELTAAQHWLELTGVSEGPEEQRRLIGLWQKWSQVTDSEREAQLSLELKNLEARDNPVHELNARPRLAELSAANLKRMLAHLEAKAAIPRALQSDPRTQDRVNKLAGEMQFAYLRRFKVKKETGVHPPVASARELRRNGYPVERLFYDELIRGAPSVGFEVIGAGKQAGPLVINGAMPVIALRLNEEFAAANAFVLPRFSDPLEMLKFFAEWDPPAVLEVLRYNRMSLPFNIKSAAEFLAYLTPERVSQVFPDHALYERLAPLRTRLAQYILTESDAREFMTAAFRIYLQNLLAGDPNEFAAVEKEMRRAAGAQIVFNKKVLPLTGWPAVSLRVPVSVPPAAYSILRVENVTYDPLTSSPLPGPHRARRLDHDSKP